MIRINRKERAARAAIGMPADHPELVTRRPGRAEWHQLAKWLAETWPNDEYAQIVAETKLVTAGRPAVTNFAGSADGRNRPGDVIWPGEALPNPDRQLTGSRRAMGPTGWLAAPESDCP